MDEHFRRNGENPIIINKNIPDYVSYTYNHASNIYECEYTLLYSTVSIKCNDKCENCHDCIYHDDMYCSSPLDKECICNTTRDLEYTHVLVFVEGKPVKTLPVDSVFIIRIIKGNATTDTIDDKIQNINENIIGEFSIYNQLDTIDVSHGRLIKRYLHFLLDNKYFDYTSIAKHGVNLMINNIKTDEDIININTKSFINIPKTNTEYIYSNHYNDFCGKYCSYINKYYGFEPAVSTNSRFFKGIRDLEFYKKEFFNIIIKSLTVINDTTEKKDNIHMDIRKKIRK